MQDFNMGDEAVGGHDMTIDQQHIELMLVFPKYKTLFAPVPKTGITSIKTWFLQIHGKYDGVNAHVPVQEYGLPKALKEHRVTIDDIEENYFKFSVVRNPFYRLISAYVHFFIRDKLSYRPVANMVQGKMLTFAELVDLLSSMPAAAIDPHFRPQYTFITGFHFNGIGRSESLNEFMVDVGVKIGADIVFGIHKNTNKYDPRVVEGAAHMAPELFEQLAPAPESFLLDKEVNARIVELYKEDFRFWYPEEMEDNDA